MSMAREATKDNKRKAVSAPDAKVRKKAKREVREGFVYVIASFNNTIITVTGPHGETLAQSSSAACGFKGARKSTPFAALQAGEKAAQAAMAKYGLKEVHVRVKGPGPGRESAVRALMAAGLVVKTIEDVTPIPFNGCRPAKKRRV